MKFQVVLAVAPLYGNCRNSIFKDLFQAISAGRENTLCSAQPVWPAHIFIIHDDCSV